MRVLGAVMMFLVAACGGNVRDDLSSDASIDASVDRAVRDVGTDGNGRGPPCTDDTICEAWSPAAYCLAGRCCIGDSDPVRPSNCICGPADRGCDYLDVCCNAEPPPYAPSKECVLAATATTYCF
jgi:hypothetical protein